MANTQAPLPVCSSTPSSWPLPALVLTWPSGYPPLMTDLHGAWLFSVQWGVASRKKLRGDKIIVGLDHLTGLESILPHGLPKNVLYICSKEESYFAELLTKVILSPETDSLGGAKISTFPGELSHITIAWDKVNPPSDFASVKRNMLHQATDHCSWGSNIYFIYIQRICIRVFSGSDDTPNSKIQMGKHQQA